MVSDVHAFDLHRPPDVFRHVRQADQVKIPVLAILRPRRGHKLQEHRHRVLLAAILVGHNPRHHPIRLCKLLRRMLPSPTPLLSSPWPCITHVNAIDIVVIIATSPLLSSSASLIASHGRHQRHEIIIITRHQHHPQQQLDYRRSNSYRLHDAHRPDRPNGRALLLLVTAAYHCLSHHCL